MCVSPGIMLIKNVVLGIRMHTTLGTMIIEAGGFKGGPQGPLVSDAALAASQPPAGSAHKQYCGIPTGLTLRWMPSPRSTEPRRVENVR